MTDSINPARNIPPPPPNLPAVPEDKQSPDGGGIAHVARDGDKGIPTRLQRFKTSLARFLGIEHFNFKNIRARRAQIREQKFPLLKRNEASHDKARPDVYAAIAAVYRREMYNQAYVKLGVEQQAEYKKLGIAVVDAIKAHTDMTAMTVEEKQQIYDNLTRMDQMVGDPEQHDVVRFKEQFIEG